MNFNFGEWHKLMTDKLGDKWWTPKRMCELNEDVFLEHPWTLLPEELKNAYAIARKEAIENKKEDAQYYLVKANIPKKFIDYDKYYSICTELRAKLPFLLVLGSSGTDKTGVVCSFANYYINQVSIYYCSASEFQAGCEDREVINEISLYEHAKSVGLLIIDNLGGEQARYRNYVTDIIKHRLDNVQSTIYVSNLNKTEFDEKYKFISNRIINKTISIFKKV